MTVGRLLRPHVTWFAGVAGLQVIGALAGLAPLLAVAEVGRVMLAPGPTDHDHLRTVVILGAAGLLVRLVFTSASAGLGHLLDGRVQLTLRRELAAALGRAPLGWLDHRRTGELAKVAGDDVDAVHPFLAHAPGELTAAFVVPLVSLIYLLTVDWRLTLVTLVPVVTALLLVPLLMTSARTAEQKAFDLALGRIADTSVEYVRGIAVVKAFGGAGRAHRRFLTAADDFVDIFTRWVRGVSAVAAGMQLALSPPFVLLAILTGGTVMITSGRLAPADLLPFLLLGLGLTAPVAALGHGFDDLQAAGRAAGRIRDVLAVEPLPEPVTPVVPEGDRIELCGVRFGYDGREVLRGVDLTVEPGTITALTGPSGSGKSTLVRLLPRFFDPDAGSVRIGGVDLRDIGRAELRRRISFVFQEVRLLRTSVADNIALAVPEADRDAVIHAAKLAHIHDRIVELPRGYDTVLGDEVELSGGEAQRIALARALAAQTPILVLDEATAFADPETDRAVRETLATLRDRTILVIAHRPETIAGADTVVTLRDGGDRPMIRTLLRVLGRGYAAPMRRTVALMVLTAIVEGLLYALLVPLLRALLGDSPADARPWLAGFAVAVAGYALLRYRSDLAGMRVGTTMLRGMYHRLGRHLARLPIGWFTGARIGEVSTMAGRGLLTAMGVAAHLMAPFVSACVTPLTIVVVILLIDWRLGLVALLAAPVVVGVHLAVVRSTAAADAGHARRSAAAAARVVEFLQAQPVLRAGGRDGFGPLDHALREVERASRRRTLAVLPGAVGLAVTVQVVFTAVLALGVGLAAAGSPADTSSAMAGGGGFATVAELLAVLVLAARAADPLLSLSDIGGRLRAARGELDRLDQLLHTAPLPEPADPIRPDRHDVEFESVTSRDGDRVVLDRLSLTVPEGQRLAIVGPSGAGKSTVLRLLARFADVDGGAIRIGGVDVRDMDPADLMARIAIVFQDVYLFDGTIEDNIRLGRPDATDREVRAAATAAMLDEVVDRLPDGWSTIVGEGGALLSGGERQRVSIARALLKDAPIVLLDEVSSALDMANETAVHDGIDRLMSGRTVIMVAHRTEAVRRADRVVVLAVRQ
ncbi:ABC transporter ATP-binding protein [Actinoplanes sichuanensis]|uniref:ABC transporter ATP-binding protein n=1 Tax=Actinoplanes sichuanensis TaxID=512349 RepID=A0ABW4AAK1_9ACTN|nr:ABC transporter ATP-binding protein [Actinoplanes sichuanensis]